jgi:hypothetical protein
VTAYSIYSQLHSVTGGLLSICNLRTRHAVVTRDPPNMDDDDDDDDDNSRTTLPKRRL